MNGRNRMRNMLVAWLISVGTAAPVEAARFPDPQANGMEWLYVFGAQGKRQYGAAEQPKKTFFIEVPKGLGQPVTIAVLDADVRGRNDEQDGAWDTSTKFSVFGKAKLLQTQTITPADPDGTIVKLGPFGLDQGSPRGELVAFRVEVEGLSGDDNNLFAFDVEPAQAQLFAYDPAIRLAEHQGSRMRLYPEIPGGAKQIRAWNYDLDPQGGSSTLLLSAKLGKGIPIRNSGSAEWADTFVPLPDPWAGGRAVYQVTKATQPRANMSMRFEDEQGKPLRIYFAPGEPVQQVAASCNTFEFDASKSYDPDNQQLTYRWDFGDGLTSDQMRVRHAFAKPGDYNVMLTVTDNSTAACRQSKTKQWLRVNGSPSAVIEAAPTSCAGSTIRLSAAKSADAGDQLRYVWDLGDGTTAEGMEVTHRYPRGGTYQVKLTVDDGAGTSCSRAQSTAAIRVNSPPLARANNPVNMCLNNAASPLEVAFDATSSQDSDGDALTYRWDFGDGTTGEGARVTHRYGKGGRYLAKLQVDDGAGMECSLASALVPVTINRAPLVRVTPRGAAMCSWETLAFDASASEDPDGDALTYRWDFGDGEMATGSSVQHRYAKGGMYHMRLNVDDGSGTTCGVSSIGIVAKANDSPRATMNVAGAGCAGQSVSFDANESADPEGQRLTYRWDFGDGTVAEGPAIQHTYAKGGLYPVSLTVDDGQGTACSLASAKADLRVNSPPLASAGPNLVCCREHVAAFDASKSMDPDGDPLVYRWDFGDGTMATGEKVEHAYDKSGTYTVKLIASDNRGTACSLASTGFVASVSAPPVAQMAILGEGRMVSPTAGESKTP